MKKIAIIIAALVMAMSASAQKPKEMKIRHVPLPMPLVQLMDKLPQLPTEQQYMNYKEYELRGEAEKLQQCEVARFVAAADSLARLVPQVACQSLDSAQRAARFNMELETVYGLNPKAIKDYKKMSAEEQRGFLQGHRNDDQAAISAKHYQQLTDKATEPLQPLIKRWVEADSAVQRMLDEADRKCLAIYESHYPRMAAAKGSDREVRQLNYYSEVLRVRRAAVANALDMRRGQQLGLSIEIERQMEVMRNADPKHSYLYPNYIEKTAQRYLTQVLTLAETPFFKAEE